MLIHHYKYVQIFFNYLRSKASIFTLSTNQRERMAGHNFILHMRTVKFVKVKVNYTIL